MSTVKWNDLSEQVKVDLWEYRWALEIIPNSDSDRDLRMPPKVNFYRIPEGATFTCEMEITLNE